MATKPTTGYLLAQPSWHVVQECEIAPIVVDHSRLRRLCDDLEHLADGLPGTGDWSLVEACCRELAAFLPLAMERKERFLTRLRRSQHGDDLSAIVAARVQARHLATSIDAEDLVAVLHAPPAERPAPDALAYMLRCFFEGVRSDVAFETLALLTIARDRLDPDAAEALLHSMANGAVMRPPRVPPARHRRGW
jgi:hypothetical protein